MVEIEAGGQTYRIDRLDAFQQFDLLRRVAPAAAGLIGAGAGGGLEALKTALEAVADMPADRFREVLNLALSCVSRRIEGGAGWAKLLAPGGGKLMFEDIAGGDMLNILRKAVEVQLGGFFPSPALP